MKTVIEWALIFAALVAIVGLTYAVLPPDAPQVVAEFGGWFVLALFGLFVLVLIRAALIGAWRVVTWNGSRPNMEASNPRPDGLTESPAWYDRERARKQELVNAIASWRQERHEAARQGKPWPEPPKAE